MSSFKWPAQGTGDTSGPSTSVDGEVAVFNGTTGKSLKRATGSGPARLASGVLGTGNTALGSEVSGVLPVANGGTNSSTALNNNRVMQSSGGKIQEAAAITASRALVSDANGIPTHAATTAAELGYVNGVTSAIQTQLDAKLPKGGGTMTGTLTLVGDPSGSLDAATKQYVDSVAAGLDIKPSVRAATTANITLSGAQTIDGVSVVAGDRVLVKNQTTTANNGIYVAAAGAWARATDMDAWAEVPGAFCFVEEGTTYADTAFVCTANQGGTLGTTSITWAQFAGVGTYSADGSTLQLVGTIFSIPNLGVGTNQIAASAVTDAKVATGIDAAKLGTGVVSNTEFGYLDGVTSAIQTQIDNVTAAKGVVAVSTNVTLTNQRIHLVDTSAARSLTLPSPATTSFIVIKDKTGSCATNNITVVRAGTEKIETVAASYTLDVNLGSWTFVSDGTDWFII